MNDCTVCGGPFDDDECVVCRDVLRVLERTIGSEVKSREVMRWVEEVARHAANRAVSDYASAMREAERK